MLPLPRKGDDAMKYVCKRILMLLVTMVIVSLLAFAAFELIHGSAAEIMLGTQATPERVAELEAELGLDRPFAVRYLEWLAGFFTGDLGISYSYSQPVWELIAPKVGITLCLSLLSFALIAYLKSGMFSLILAISITAWTGTARILRTRVKQICELPYIKIEKAMGVSAPVIMVRHILPNLKDILLTRMALSVSGAMTTESGLSFLGLGTYGQKSWGNILHFAFFRNSILRKQIWWYLPPIICISVAVMGFMLVGYYGRQRRE